MDSKDHRRTIDVCTEIEQERFRQLSQEGFMPERDDAYDQGQLAQAAAAYAYSGSLGTAYTRKHFIFRAKGLFPWANEWWKPTTPRRDLIKAAALLVAEIERLDRASEKEQG